MYGKYKWVNIRGRETNDGSDSDPDTGNIRKVWWTGGVRGDGEFGEGEGEAEG